MTINRTAIKSRGLYILKKIPMHHAPVVLAFLVCFGRSLEQLVWKINRRVVVFCLVMVEES